MRRSLRFRLLAVAPGIGLAITAYACFGGVVDSIHFYTEDNYSSAASHFVDFGRAPQEFMLTGWNNEMQRGAAGNTTSWDIDDGNYGWGQGRYKLVRARNLEAAGHFDRAMRVYATLTSETKLDSYLQDRRELFDSLRGRGKVAGVDAYLRFTYLTLAEQGDYRYAASRVEAGPVLRPHVLYAAADRMVSHYRDKARAYARAHYGQLPSGRGEAGLIMAARTLANSHESPASSEDWAAASHYARELMRAYPQSRFVSSAIGILAIREAARGRFDQASRLFSKSRRAARTPIDKWRADITWARVLARAGLRRESVYAGLRAWGSAPSEKARGDIGLELKHGFRRLSAAESRQLRQRLGQDADLLSGYLGFRIEDSRLSIAEERELAKFASQSILSMPRPTASAAARAAQLSYNIGSYSDARRAALRALALPGDASAEGRARYVLAASLGRMGRPSEAIGQYQRLVRSPAPQYLRQSALEPLAILLERRNRPVEALLAYVELGYVLDIAVTADAFLTIPQLRQAISRVKPSMARDVLRFTLAMRLMRRDDYVGARAEFRRLGGEKTARWGLSKAKFKQVKPSIGWRDDDFPPNPIATLNRLEALHRQYLGARSYDARAQALYDKAAFIYRSQSLVFYSPGLWQGDRAFSMDMYWNAGFETRKQKRMLSAHFWDHEATAHSLRLCRQIIEKFPRSKVMPKALYTAAISANRLGGLNGWWRGQPVPLHTAAAKYLSRLYVSFPNDPLAAAAKKYAKVFDPKVVAWKP